MGNLNINWRRTESTQASNRWCNAGQAAPLSGTSGHTPSHALPCPMTAMRGRARPAGAHDEFVFVGRLDNLAMSFCSTRALVDAFPDAASLAGEAAVKAVALFDHEEVGSASAQGAVSLSTCQQVDRFCCFWAGRIGPVLEGRGKFKTSRNCQIALTIGHQNGFWWSGERGQWAL